MGWTLPSIFELFKTYKGYVMAYMDVEIWFCVWV